MMKKLMLLSFLVFNAAVMAQENVFISESEAAQTELNEEYKNPETTILEPGDFKNFKGLEFFPINLKYRVEAKLIRTPDEKPFLMPTSTARLPEYVKYGEAHFNLEGKAFVLKLFKSAAPEVKPEYEDYLFLP